MTADISLELSGKPGDPPPPPARENFTGQGLNAWLDSAAGQAMAAQYGGRAQAAAAMAEAEAARRAWRRQQAVPRAEMFPGRYASVDDAMNAIPDPAGGGGALLTGTEQDIADAARRADPSKPWHVVHAYPNAAVQGISQGPGTAAHLADTRPPLAARGLGRG